MRQFDVSNIGAWIPEPVSVSNPVALSLGGSSSDEQRGVAQGEQRYDGTVTCVMCPGSAGPDTSTGSRQLVLRRATWS